ILGRALGSSEPLGAGFIVRLDERGGGIRFLGRPAGGNKLFRHVASNAAFKRRPRRDWRNGRWFSGRRSLLYFGDFVAGMLSAICFCKPRHISGWIPHFNRIFPNSRLRREG